MDIRQVLSDNAIKDMLAEEDSDMLAKEDSKFLTAVNAVLVGQKDPDTLSDIDKAAILKNGWGPSIIGTLKPPHEYMLQFFVYETIGTAIDFGESYILDESTNEPVTVQPKSNREHFLAAMRLGGGSRSIRS